MPFCSPRSHTVKENNPDDTFVRLQVCFCYRLESRAYRFWESKTESQVPIGATHSNAATRLLCHRNRSDATQVERWVSDKNGV